MYVFVWLFYFYVTGATFFLKANKRIFIRFEKNVAGLYPGGNVMFRVNSDSKNYLVIYW